LSRILTQGYYMTVAGSQVSRTAHVGSLLPFVTVRLPPAAGSGPASLHPRGAT
jgi:hypothetical protein